MSDPVNQSLEQKRYHHPDGEKRDCCSSNEGTCCSLKQGAGATTCSSKKQAGNSCCEQKAEKSGCCAEKKEESCCEGKPKVQQQSTCAKKCCDSEIKNLDVDQIGVDVQKRNEEEKKKEETISEAEYKKWVKIALGLSIFTIVWNIAEGVVSIFFGIEEETIALGIFGADSLIEVASGFVVLWRFKQDIKGAFTEGKQDKTVMDIQDKSNIQKERMSTRIIGFLLIALAGIAVAGAIINLVNQQGSDSSVPGLVISGVSISFMFFLFYYKKKAAKILNNNKTLLADAKCSLSCICLSLVLFIGSLITVIFQDKWELWWMDSAITIIMAILIIKEGGEAFIYSFSKNFQGGCGCCRIE